MKQIIIILALFFVSLTFGQESGRIAGKVTDKEFNEEPLPIANVIIKGTSKGASTDFDGLYEFDDLDPGTYILEFSFVGYETQEISAEVSSGNTTKLNVSMGANAAALDEVVIKTSVKRESETALLLDQKKSVEIKQSIGSQELSRKGVSDAAGAVAKISGVSKQEGSSNVYVRGLGDRYLATTLNGLPIPSNDVNKKNINLNLFSSDIIESVSISKAYASQFYGDFAAGNVDIILKEYKGKGLFEISTQSGVNTNAIDKNFVKSEGTGYFGFYGRNAHNPFAIILSHGIDPVDAGTPLNINYGATAGKSFDFKNGGRLSLFATGSFGNNFEYRKGSSVDYTLTEKKAFVNNAEEYEYGTTSTGMINLNYRIDDQNKFKFNSLFINDSADRVGYFGIDGKGRNREAFLDREQGFYQMNVQFDQTSILVNQLLGNHKSGKFEIDWGMGYNNVFSNQPDRKRISLENYQFALDNDPSTNPTFYSNVVFDNQRYFQEIKDEEYNGLINLAYEASEHLKFNFGYNGRSKTRTFENIRYGYDIVDTDFPVTNVNNFDNVFTLDNLDIDNTSNGVYDIKVINSFGGLSNTNRPGSPENTYQGALNIYSGHANAEIKAGDKWLFVPGVRFEAFTQRIDFNVINLGSLGNSSVTSEQNFLLPSLNIKYGLTEDQNLRFSASQTVSIPEFKEVAPFVYEDISTRIGGNPDLLKKGFSEIINLDLKYEWFFSRSEILSLAVFTKQINDPINLVVGADATGTQRYFRTGDKASVYGVELEVRKSLMIDEDSENPKLSAGLNATYMSTKQDLYKSIDGDFYDVSFTKTEEELQGASPLILNADISYSPTFENYKPIANLVFSYFSNRIDALGSGQLGNVIEKGIPTLDFIWKNTIKDKFEINLSAKNLLNPNIRYYRETSLGNITVNSANGKGVSDYKRGLNIGLQLNYKF